MTTFPIKIAIAGVGVTGIASGGIYYLIQRNNKTEKKVSTNTQPIAIKSLLQTAGKPILGKTNNDKKWNKNWGTFKTDYASKVTKNSWTFTETSNLSSVSVAPENFKDKCLSNSETKIKEEEKESSTLYKEILAYCTDHGE